MGLADGVGAPADGADGGGGEGAESSGELLTCVGIRLIYPPPSSSVHHAPADDPVYVVQLEEAQERTADRQHTAHRTPYLHTAEDVPPLLPASALELLATLFQPSRWVKGFSSGFSLLLHAGQVAVRPTHSRPA